MEYASHRESFVEQTLTELFNQHPDSRKNGDGEPSIPGNAIGDILRQYAEKSGSDIVSAEEERELHNFLASQPDIECTPSTMVKLITMMLGSLPQAPPDHPDSRSASESPPLIPPKTPMNQMSTHHSNRSVDSPFESKNRQRSTPLGSAPPSSFSRKPNPPTRRRSSSAGYGYQSSGDESTGGNGRRRSRGPRSRAPSNPTSPMSSFNSPHSDYPSFTRSNSQTQFSQFPPTFGDNYGRSPSPVDATSLAEGVNSLVMPRGGAESGSDSEEDGEDHTLYIHERSETSSTASMEPFERLSALQKQNAELMKRNADNERILRRQIADRESELEEMEQRLEETRNELMATKREEKELRTKERASLNELANLEQDIAKLQRALEQAKANYSSLQKLYQDQCAESERHRNTLRRRDTELADYKHNSSLHEIEKDKWAQIREQNEQRIVQLESELVLLREVETHLGEQKQENFMLKETIDRLRFEMDDMRTNANPMAQTTGPSSVPASLSKSLGQELLGKMGDWDSQNDADDEDETTAVEDVQEKKASDGESEDDIVQTIITRTKKKTAGKANPKILRVTETKNYSDAFTQYDVSEFRASAVVQTDAEPKTPMKASTSIQTDESLQTSSPSPQASSSKPSLLKRALHPKDPLIVEEDAPPQYYPPTPKTQSSEHALDPKQIEEETLRNHHKGVEFPVRGLPDGVPAEIQEEWEDLKQELGIQCDVIDEVIKNSPRTDRERKGVQRLYNIYNTYIIRRRAKGKAKSSHTDDEDDEYVPPPPIPTAWAQNAIAFGIWGLVFAAGLPYLTSAGPYNIPGGPTAHDRAAWTAYNNLGAGGGPGFPGFAGGRGADQAGAFWTVLTGLLQGGALIARGLPT